LYRRSDGGGSEAGAVKQVPWGDGKRHLTRAYAVFLATWARRLSWKEVATIFQVSWEKVYRSVAWVVENGLEHRHLDGITAIGVDEVQFQKGHRYLTVVYQINAGCRRLLWVGQDRTTKTLLRFLKMLGRERTAALEFICSDMWQPHLKVIAPKTGQAIHILDRFHITISRACGAACSSRASSYSGSTPHPIAPADS